MAKNITAENNIKKNRTSELISLLSPDFYTSLKRISISHQLLIKSAVFFNFFIITLILSSLVFESSFNDISILIKSVDILSAFKITILSISVSALLTVIFGVPLSLYIAEKKNIYKKLLNVIIKLPILMPPSVTGLALLLTFGRRGTFSFLMGNLKFSLPFSFAALIIVQVFVMIPLFTLSLKNAFAETDKNIIEAAITEGADKKELLYNIYLPLNMRAFITGIIMAVLRGAGEFGATIMFAGNLSGKTQTLSTAVYSLTQTSLSQAVLLALLMLLSFILPLLILEFSKKSN